MVKVRDTLVAYRAMFRLRSNIDLANVAKLIFNHVTMFSSIKTIPNPVFGLFVFFNHILICRVDAHAQKVDNKMKDKYHSIDGQC